MSQHEPPTMILPEPALNGFRNPITGLTAIMTNEDREAQLEFVREFVADLDPQGRVEIWLARTVALDAWRINRIKAVEENLFAYGQILPKKNFTHPIPQVEHAVGHSYTFMLYSKAMNIISLIESRLQQTIRKNLDQLLKLQARRTQTQSQTQPAPAFETHSQTAGATAAAQPRAA